MSNCGLYRHNCCEKVHRLRLLLETIEWGQEPINLASECPWCLNQKIDGHSSDCAVGKELALPSR